MSYQTPLFPSNRPLTTVDSVYQWIPGGSPTSIIPPGSKQLSGWVIDEKPPSQYFNGLYGANAQWITFLDTMIGDFDFDTFQKIGLGFEAFKGAIGNLNQSVGLGAHAAEDSDGDDIVAIGFEAARGVVGSAVVAIGTGAALNATGSNIVAIGFGSAVSSSGVIIAMGTSAASAMVNTVGPSIAIGGSAGAASATQRSILIGESAGSASNLQHVVAIGTSAAGIATMVNTTAIGGFAGNNSDLTNAVVIGHNALTNMTIAATDIVCIGAASGNSGITGNAWVAIGKDAMTSVVGSMTDAIAIGHGAAASATEGTNGIFIGKDAGVDAASFEAIMIGLEVGTGFDSSSTPILVGQLAGKDGGGDFTVRIGALTGNNLDSDYSVLVGHQAGIVNVATPTQHNIIGIGHQAGGFASVNSESIYVGSQSGVKQKGTRCIYIGNESGFEAFVPTVTSDDTVVIGYKAGFEAENLHQGVFLGSSAGNNSNSANTVSLGYNAGFIDFSTGGGPPDIGNNLTHLGSGAGYQGAAPIFAIPDNSIFLGYNSGKNWQPTGGLATIWGDLVTAGVSVMKISKNSSDDFLFGYLTTDLNTSVVGSLSPFKVGILSVAQRATFAGVWGTTPEAHGTMSFDTTEDKIYVYTSAGTWKGVVVA